MVSDEPASRLLCQGMVVAETFFRDSEASGRHYFNPAEVVMERDERGRIIGARHGQDGQPVVVGPLEKMSKSKNNGVDPQALIDRYGADTVRLFSMFASPPDQSLEWSDAGVEGASRFLRRLWRELREHLAAGPVATLDSASLSSPQRALRAKLHQTIAKVSDDYNRRHTFNTAIAAIMELMNAMTRAEDSSPQGRAVLQEGWEAVVMMLNPVVPHICRQLWAALGRGECLDEQPFPVVDPAALVRDLVTMVVQVNGKLRGQFEVPPGSSREEVERLALSEQTVQRFLEGLTVRKVIVVPDKLVNVVAG